MNRSYAQDFVMLQAQKDLSNSLNAINQLPCRLSDAKLDGRTTTLGVYLCAVGSVAGELVLDAPKAMLRYLIVRVAGTFNAKRFKHLP